MRNIKISGERFQVIHK